MSEIKEIKISVIVPVFNKAPYLHECFPSILAQTVQNFEVILVDDGSTDGSWEILCEYAAKDSRFSAYRMEKNGGPGPARNRGIQKATGKYCLFCDADDAYPPYAFQMLLEHAEKYQADVACGNVFPMDEHLRHFLALDAAHMALAIKEEALVRNLDHPALWWPLYHQRFLIATALLLKKNITYPALRIGEDPVFLAEVLCAAESVAIIPHAVYFYRILPKKSMRDSRSWLLCLDHFRATLDTFICAGQGHCACLFYALSIPAWHNFSCWRRMTREERAEERAKFAAYAAKIRPHAPWDQDYAPYPVDCDALQRRETFYLRYGHGLSCLHMSAWGLVRKISSLFARLKACM